MDVKQSTVMGLTVLEETCFTFPQEIFNMHFTTDRKANITAFDVPFMGYWLGQGESNH